MKSSTFASLFIILLVVKPVLVPCTQLSEVAKLSNFAKELQEQVVVPPPELEIEMKMP